MTSSPIDVRSVVVEHAPPRPRPVTEYWDHRTASWRVASPIPTPRRG